MWIFLSLLVAHFQQFWHYVIILYIVTSNKMNSLNNNNHITSGVVQDKKVCIQVLGRGACSKSKLHCPPQVDCNSNPINVFATCLGRQIRAVHSICTWVGPKHWDLTQTIDFCRKNIDGDGKCFWWCNHLHKRLFWCHFLINCQKSLLKKAQPAIKFQGCLCFH